MPLFASDARAEAVELMRLVVQSALSGDHEHAERFKDDKVLVRFLQSKQWDVSAAAAALIEAANWQGLRRGRGCRPSASDFAPSAQTTNIPRPLRSQRSSISLAWLVPLLPASRRAATPSHTPHSHSARGRR